MAQTHYKLSYKRNGFTVHSSHKQKTKKSKFLYSIISLKIHNIHEKNCLIFIVKFLTFCLNDKKICLFCEFELKTSHPNRHECSL